MIALSKNAAVGRVPGPRNQTAATSHVVFRLPSATDVFFDIPFSSRSSHSCGANHRRHGGDPSSRRQQRAKEMGRYTSNRPCCSPADEEPETQTRRRYGHVCMGKERREVGRCLSKLQRRSASESRYTCIQKTAELSSECAIIRDL